LEFEMTTVDGIAWNAARVTRASLDKQPHDVAAMFARGRKPGRPLEWRNLPRRIVAPHCGIRRA
jgi:hypothetical protein